MNAKAMKEKESGRDGNGEVNENGGAAACRERKKIYIYRNHQIAL